MTALVLIVDDEESFLMLLDHYLMKNGFHVKTASNSNQALNLVDQETFDVAILDVNMSPVDGITLLTELKKRSPSTRVIMATAYPTPDLRNECMRRGASEFLTKPLDLSEVQTAAHSLLNQAKAEIPDPAIALRASHRVRPS
jgi:DNA-binding NtrC family response regulator